MHYCQLSSIASAVYTYTQLYDDVELPEQLAKEARALPEASAVSVPDGLPNSAFGEAVMCTEFLHAHAHMLQAYLPKADDVTRAVGTGGSRARRALAISSAVSATATASASGSGSAAAASASAADAAKASAGDGDGDKCSSVPTTSSSPALDLSPPPPPTPSEYTLKRLRQWLLVDRFLQALVGRDRDSLDVLLAVLDPLVKFILRDYKFKVRHLCARDLFHCIAFGKRAEKAFHLARQL